MMIEFPPTFLDLARIDLSSVGHLDGVSLQPTLDGTEEAVHDHLYFEIGFARGVITKDWKYISVRYDEEVRSQIDKGVTFMG